MPKLQVTIHFETNDDLEDFLGFCDDAGQTPDEYVSELVYDDLDDVDEDDQADDVADVDEDNPPSLVAVDKK